MDNFYFHLENLKDETFKETEEFKAEQRQVSDYYNMQLGTTATREQTAAENDNITGASEILNVKSLASANLDVTNMQNLPVPQTEGLSYKEKKERKKHEKKQLNNRIKGFKKRSLKEQGQPISDYEMNALKYTMSNPDGHLTLAGKSIMDKKEKQSKFTNREILNQMRENDYSHFDNLNYILKHMAATQFMKGLRDAKDPIFRRSYKNLKNEDPKLLAEVIVGKENQNIGNAMNPLLRLGISQMAKELELKNVPFEDNIYRKLDLELTRRIMVSTLTTVGDVNEHGEEMVNRNTQQRKIMAKQFLLMQLGKVSAYKKVKHPDKNGPKLDKVSTDGMPIAFMISQGGRVIITTPKKGNPDDEARMWNSITRNLNAEGKYTNEANIKRRTSTHTLRRRKVAGNDIADEGKAKIMEFVGQTGMNAAIGGLGKSGVSGQQITNGGSCGHVYSAHKTSNSNKFGVYCFGYETEEPGHSNQMGHTHDISATAATMSSFGGQKTDVIGDKYGGRQADLSGLTPLQITVWMDSLDKFMSNANEADMQTVADMLTGELLSDEKIKELGRILNISGHNNAGTADLSRWTD